LAQLQQVFSAGCIAFNDATTAAGTIPAGAYEDIAMQNDDVLENFLDVGTVADDTVRQMIRRREVFPCYFGAALKLDGIDDLLAGLEQWTREPEYSAEFGAKVFKISHDDKGERLTWVRVTGGVLANKDVILDEQKVNQLRVYNGAKFTIRPSVAAGEVCAIPNLTGTHPGQGLGEQAAGRSPEIQPVLNYTLDPQGHDIHECLTILQQLEDEDPQLHVAWSSHLQEIRVQIMGAVQLEILQQILRERFNLDVGFGEGSILYKETVTRAVEGVGHFEPLRHYAEVHLLMQPAPRGSGVTFAADCDLEVLGKNWQHQVLTSLRAKEHLGVLTGSPLTDVKITLISGRASIVHSVGGDFREATWRAVRQGLMMAKVQNQTELLEPWYRFRLEVGQDQVGRAMTDIQRTHGSFETPNATAPSATGMA